MPKRIGDREGWKGTRLLSHWTRTVAKKLEVEDRNEVNFNWSYILEETGSSSWDNETGKDVDSSRFT